MNSVRETIPLQLRLRMVALGHPDSSAIPGQDIFWLQFPNPILDAFVSRVTTVTSQDDRLRSPGSSFRYRQGRETTAVTLLSWRMRDRLLLPTEMRICDFHLLVVATASGAG